MNDEVQRMRPMVVAALEYHGGTARMIEVAEFIWTNNEKELRSSGDLFFRWQYVMRWSATTLRKDGVMLDAADCERGTWALA
ncbi:uncharacterized protein METZ01_LOCUS458360 [marine metagenome]|uniref:Restriction system protein Mrr-like N-terminal domain-containing protein n=1 Tax=marine metagenome TaxID=408172 RepID=A0A383ACA6_9ZZZZ